MKTGTKVSHPVHGLGTVLRTWGSWRACFVCRGPVDGRGRCEIRAHNTIKATADRPWLHAHSLDISAADVVDVDFGEFGVHSLNVCLVTKVPVLRSKRILVRLAKSHSAQTH
jgi:hypothetical protein